MQSLSMCWPGTGTRNISDRRGRGRQSAGRRGAAAPPPRHKPGRGGASAPARGGAPPPPVRQAGAPRRAAPGRRIPGGLPPLRAAGQGRAANRRGNASVRGPCRACPPVLAPSRRGPPRRAPPAPRRHRGGRHVAVRHNSHAPDSCNTRAAAMMPRPAAACPPHSPWRLSASASTRSCRPRSSPTPARAPPRAALRPRVHDRARPCHGGRRQDRGVTRLYCRSVPCSAP